MKKFRVNKGYIISPETEEKRKIGDKIIYIVPVYKFLLN